MTNNDQLEADFALKPPRQGIRLHAVGFALTAAYLVLIGAYCVGVWDAVGMLTPDQLGNALGGVFAPLAFLWLVLGFLQQGQELRNSANALWLQGRELQASVEQQRELVNVTREQLEHERQRTSAAEEEAERRSQPKLLLRATMSRTDHGSSRRLFTFALVNAGAACTDVRIYLSADNPTRIPSFPTGKEQEFTIGFVPGDFDKREIPISYVDARGVEQHRTLNIIADGATLKAGETT